MLKGAYPIGPKAERNARPRSKAGFEAAGGHARDREAKRREVEAAPALIGSQTAPAHATAAS